MELLQLYLEMEHRAALGQIAMASFKNPEGLTDHWRKFIAKYHQIQDAAIIKSGSKVQLQQLIIVEVMEILFKDALEGSNVDLTEQFTDMITATRSFQAASKMITTGDEILQTITGLMR